MRFTGTQKRRPLSTGRTNNWFGIQPPVPKAEVPGAGPNVPVYRHRCRWQLRDAIRAKPRARRNRGAGSDASCLLLDASSRRRTPGLSLAVGPDQLGRWRATAHPLVGPVSASARRRPATPRRHGPSAPAPILPGQAQIYTRASRRPGFPEGARPPSMCGITSFAFTQERLYPLGRNSNHAEQYRSARHRFPGRPTPPRRRRGRPRQPITGGPGSSVLASPGGRSRAPSRVRHAAPVADHDVLRQCRVNEAGVCASASDPQTAA
jgi:hypothetical protein